jgi:type II restriction enzyme
MATIEEAQQILSALGMPKAQQTEMAASVLLALCRLRPDDAWIQARRESVTVTKGIMDFVRQQYQRTDAPNSRETFRRQVLHQFVQAGLAEYNPDNPTLPTNSPRAHYAISPIALTAIQAFDTSQWQSAVFEYLRQQPGLAATYQSSRQLNRVPVRLPDNMTVNLSPGKHNQLQAAIVQEFAPRFAPGAHLLYLGDTAQKMLVVDIERLAALGIPVTEHSKLPDIVLYDEDRDWIFLIEAVTSHGPMSPKRMVELRIMLSDCTAGRIFVSAFPDFAVFRKYLPAIAWETEVWTSDMPDHMIHFNGDRFLGPR